MAKSDKSVDKEESKTSNFPRKGKKKGKRGNSRSRGRTTSRDTSSRSSSVPSADSRGPGSSLNDLSWYARNPELLQSAAMIPFPNKPGMQLKLPNPFGEESGDNPYETQSDFVITNPGIMSIQFEYTIGNSKDVTSPASICAKELYARIRSKFSGSLDEDAPDLFMYCIALDQVHAYIAWLKRIYRTISAYSSQNYMFPELLFQSYFPQGLRDPINGVNYNDWLTEKVKLWQYINILVNMVNKFLVPADMDIYNRHRWMNENVYLDVPAVMGQMYVFAPHGFYRIEETNPYGTALKYLPLEDFAGTEGFDVEAAFAYGKEMIELLSNWDDAYTINGHIQRAFEGSDFYMCDLLGQDEIIMPVYVPEVLTQIHNLTIVSGLIPESITQNPDTNAVLSNWVKVPNLFMYTPHSTLLDCGAIVPSPAEVTIATRLMALYDDNDIICGTEFVSGVWITPLFREDIALTDLSGWMPLSNTRWALNDAASDDVHTTLLKLRSLMASTAWTNAPNLMNKIRMTHPLTYEGGETSDFWLYRFDCSNITPINSPLLAPLHRICVYSEFNCFGRQIK